MNLPLDETLRDLQVPEGLALPDGVPTGLADLDQLTGGMRPGLWLIIGPHGSGTGMWLTQLAAQTAVTQRIPVHLNSPRDDTRRLVARMLSMLGRVPLHLIEHDQIQHHDEYRHPLREAVEALRDSPLTLAPQIALGRQVNLWSCFKGVQDARVAIFNDAHLLDPVLPASILDVAAAARGRGCTVVVGLPRREVVSGDDASLREPWDREADLIIDLQRPDMHDPMSERAGEIDLSVLRHRNGPVGTISVDFQGHYARLIDHRSV